MLQPHATYDVSVVLLDERPDSVRDVTRHITAGADSHLFLFRNRPLYQPGVIDVSGGDKDHDGLPFNGRVKFTTGETGNSVMNVQLLHNPQDKHANWHEAKGKLNGPINAQRVSNMYGAQKVNQWKTARETLLTPQARAVFTNQFMTNCGLDAPVGVIA